MKTCKYCGGEVSDTAKKCKYCGEWLTASGQKTNKNKSIQNKKDSKIKRIIDIFLRVALVILIIFAFILSVNKYGDEHMDMIYNPYYEQSIFLKFIYTVNAFFYPPIPPI